MATRVKPRVRFSERSDLLDFLLEVRLDRGEIPRDEALHLLDAWAQEQGFRPGT